MEQQSFFPSSNRRVIIGSPTKQATTGRICVPIRMPLTGESLVACPEWVSTAYQAVEQYLSDGTPKVEQIADITVSFNNSKPKGKLFDDPNARIPSAELKAFSVQRCGDEEDPDVELTFKLYAPFSREFWKWLGEMAGAEVYMAFPEALGAAKANGVGSQATLGDGSASEAEKRALAGDQNPPADLPKAGKKSGPKDLADYHAKVSQ